eukprot:202857-Chlamydomonas_euryale.AAC.2
MGGAEVKGGQGQELGGEEGRGPGARVAEGRLGEGGGRRTVVHAACHLLCVADVVHQPGRLRLDRRDVADGAKAYNLLAPHKAAGRRAAAVGAERSRARVCADI